MSRGVMYMNIKGSECPVSRATYDADTRVLTLFWKKKGGGSPTPYLYLGVSKRTWERLVSLNVPAPKKRVPGRAYASLGAYVNTRIKKHVTINPRATVAADAAVEARRTGKEVETKTCRVEPKTKQ